MPGLLSGTVLRVIRLEGGTAYFFCDCFQLAYGERLRRRVSSFVMVPYLSAFLLETCFV